METSVVAHRSALRIVVALALCLLILLSQDASLLVNGTSAQGQNQSSNRQGRPWAGKPEGNLPDLEEAQTESNVQREAAPPIPSGIRSPKVPHQPWNGKRVGDPDARGELGQLSSDPGSDSFAKNHRSGRTRRAHWNKRSLAPPTVLDDQFIANFFSWALTRTPGGTEPTFWNDQLRVAYGQGQASLKLAAVELGKTLFESAEYATRQRNDHWYVYDLYKTYLMREPDASGWSHWESQVPSNGRENVRRGFEESTEFVGIVASIVPNGSATANAASLISARVDPKNQPGNGMLTRDGIWSVPLLSLPGRAGLYLGLGIYSSSAV